MAARRRRRSVTRRPRQRNGPTFPSARMPSPREELLTRAEAFPENGAMRVRQARVSEAIVHRIKKQISDGRLLAGHKLPAEREMARQFKTSRVSVREA